MSAALLVVGAESLWGWLLSLGILMTGSSLLVGKAGSFYDCLPYLDVSQDWCLFTGGWVSSWC